MQNTAEQKLENLKAYLRELGSVVSFILLEA